VPMTATQTSATGSGELCRLVIHGPSSRVELAVPAYVPLVDLLPAFLTHLGGELATSGLAHGGWVLQRLGEPPLEEDLGIAALGLCDGDAVYLRPRADQLPPVDFDDLVDGVAAATEQRGGAWAAEHTRRATLVLAGLAMAVGLAMIPGVGPGMRAALVAAAAAVVLTATLALGVAVPGAAARMAGLRIAPLPATAAEFQQDIDPEPSRELQRRAGRADAYVSALYLGAAAVCTGCLLVLGRTPGWAAPALAGTAALLLLLHTRELRGAWHRLATLVPGVAGTVAVLWSATAAPAQRQLALAGLAVAVAVLACLARMLPGRRVLPHCWRFDDLLNT